MQMNKFFKIIIILAVAGVISLGFQIGLTRKYADWLPTDGVITDIQFHHSSAGRRNSSSTYEIYYDYTVGASTYSGVNSYSGRETERFVGERVSVWYDPDNHQDASFHPPGPGLYPFVSFIFAFPLLVRIVFMKNPTKKGRKYRGNTESFR